MPVGDPRRLRVGRAAVGTLLAVVSFLAVAAAKQLKPINVHAPWEDDPYDTVLSFATFFVPLLTACFLVSVSLCRKSDPLPTSRVVTIVRTCRVAVGVIAVEVVTAWSAIAVGANRADWTPGATGALVALLALCTIATCVAVVDIGRVPRLPGTGRAPRRAPGEKPTDWLEDLATVARVQSRRLGPVRRPVVGVVDWANRNPVTAIRAHSIAAAAALSVLFGMSVLGWQALREGYSPAATVVAMSLGFCGMFAFLVLVGSYLGIARRPNPLCGVRRRTLDAGVVGCLGAIAVLAFHDDLWWIVGSNPTAAGPAQFAALESGAGLLAAVIVFTVESALRSHSNSPTGLSGHHSSDA
jgi:hypothetical protein